MGRLLYGSKVEIEMPDLSLLHLDMLLAEHPGAAFQLHVVLAGAKDGNLLSLSIGSGQPLLLELGNSRDLSIDVDVLVGMTEQLRSGGVVSLPMLPMSS